MEIPEASVFPVGITSELPSYTEAIQSPLPSTPPPSYVEAVGVPPLQLASAASPYPILYLPPAATPVQLTQQLAVQPSPHHVIPQQQGVGTLGDAPTVITCPHCCSLITTKVQNKPGRAAWALCCLLAFLGLFCGCCLIPCCMTEFQVVHHSCPACKRYLGKQLH